MKINHDRGKHSPIIGFKCYDRGKFHSHVRGTPYYRKAMLVLSCHCCNYSYLYYHLLNLLLCLILPHGMVSIWIQNKRSLSQACKWSHDIVCMDLYSSIPFCQVIKQCQKNKEYIKYNVNGANWVLFVHMYRPGCCDCCYKQYWLLEAIIFVS